MPNLAAVGAHVRLLDLGDGENRFTPEWLEEVSEHLDEVEALGRPCALVTTATGKFFSNGLDLDGLLADPDAADGRLRDVQSLLARFLISPAPTVAAIQGHAFAAGAMLTLAHDHRLMRDDRGFWCLPEIDIDIPFTLGMSELIAAKLSGPTAFHAMTTGRRYGGREAFAAGIVDSVETEGELIERALAVATERAHHAGPTLQTIKQQLFAGALNELQRGRAHLTASTNADGRRAQ